METPQKKRAKGKIIVERMDPSPQSFDYSKEIAMTTCSSKFIALKRAEATVINNRILDNGRLAIGVRNGSKIIAEKNTLSRKGGMPLLIAVLDNSRATLIENDLSGGGVAGILLQGNAVVKNNRFHGNGPRKGGPPNFAIWVREGSEVTFSCNRVEKTKN